MARQTEIQMELLGDKDAEEKIADIILETRRRLDAVKQRKQVKIIWSFYLYRLAVKMCPGLGLALFTKPFIAGLPLFRGSAEIPRIKKKFFLRLKIFGSTVELG